MKSYRACVQVGLVAALFLFGCGQQKLPHRKQARVIRLFDLFQPEDLSAKISPEELGIKRVEWKAEEMMAWTPPAKIETNSAAEKPPVIGFSAFTNLADLRVDQGKLTGNVTGASPVVHFTFKSNRGGAESVKFVELRMQVTGAKKIWLRVEGGSNLDESSISNWVKGTNWNTSVDVDENKTEPYRFEIRGPKSDLRHLFISLREGDAPKFTIESVRFVTEREEKLKEASGQQWAGLGEIYHASLALKTSEAIKMPLRDLPEAAALDVAIGTSEDSPVKFTVAIGDRDGAKGVTPKTLFERTVTIPNRWKQVRINLGSYTGKNVLLELSASGEKKGLWGYFGSPTIRSHSTAASTASANGKRKPRGVIFLVTDTLRKDHLNIYGYSRETLVHLKKFAAEGVAFSHAISQGTMTKISTPSMVTSLYPLSHTVLGFEKGLPASAKTIAEVFRDEGYATVSYSSVPFTGKSNNMHQGYDELHEKGSTADGEYDSKTAREYVDRLITWLQDHSDTPFFVFLHVFDPHSPFRPRPPYDTMWAGPGAKERMAELEADMKREKIPTPMGLPTKEGYLKTKNDPDELLNIYKDWYDGSIRGMDAEMGRLLETLRDLGLENDTLFVWSADHGEEFWEHGRLFHGHSVYGELNQVPLVFRWPNNPDIRKGVMVEKQVQNIDIMPTILDLVGIVGPTNMQGRTLLPLLNGHGLGNWEELPAVTQAMVGPPPGAPPGTNSEPKPHFGIIDRGWKLIRKEVAASAELELYEHPVDYLNLTNVISASGAEAHVNVLASGLDTWKTQAKAAELPNDDAAIANLSSEELRRLRALGYVGGAPAPKPAATNNPTKTTNAPAAAPEKKDGH